MWDVKDGAIHIDTACEHPTGTTYIIWKGGEAADFILKYDMKGTISVNGGMQFRSFLTEDPNAPKYPPPPGRWSWWGRPADAAEAVAARHLAAAEEAVAAVAVGRRLPAQLLLRRAQTARPCQMESEWLSGGFRRQQSVGR